MAKLIPLTQGKFAIVDDEDYEWAMQWKWFAMRKGRNWYVARDEWEGANKETIYLHREITNAPDGMEVDHTNGDGLDNQRENLRVCTHAENLRNRGTSVNNTSGYKGVTWHEGTSKWRAKIMVSGKDIHLGLFVDPAEAAQAYDKAAKEHFGEFARPNFDQSRHDTTSVSGKSLSITPTLRFQK